MAPAIGLRQPANYGVRTDVNASPPDDFGRSLPSSAREWQTRHTSPAAPARRRSQVKLRVAFQGRDNARASDELFKVFHRRTSTGTFATQTATLSPF